MKRSCCFELSVATAISVNVTFVPLRNTSDGPGLRIVLFVRPHPEPASAYKVTFVCATIRIVPNIVLEWYWHLYVALPSRVGTKVNTAGPGPEKSCDLFSSGSVWLFPLESMNQLCLMFEPTVSAPTKAIVSGYPRKTVRV